MRLALDGDQGAYRTLLTCVAPYVRSVARNVLPQMDSAGIEDIVQETLLAVHLKRTTWDRSLPILPWLSAVARHKAIDAVRRKGGRIDIDIADLADRLAADDSDGEGAMDTETMLASLGQRDRVIVERIYLGGLSAAEVGAELTMSEGAVRVALHRALKALADKFKGSRS